MTFRKLLFWAHLIVGCAGGLVILMMSATGVLLMYERQILARLERGPFQLPAGSVANRLPVDDLLDRVEGQRGLLPRSASLVVRSSPAEPVEISLGREGGFYVDPRDGRVLGAPAPGPRRFFQRITAWHRWFGVEGEGRATARAITGASNLGFLFIVLSGLYLWMPAVWSWRHVRPILWFRRGLSGKARDFNWHNAFGLWAAIPLAIVVATALPMSYSWANALLYRLTGTEAPAQAGPPGGGPPRGGARGGGGRPQLSTLWQRAESHAPGWRSISLRLPGREARAVEFVIDHGDGGQPQLRGNLTLDTASGEVKKWETLSDANAGRQWRMWSRFAHTGEYYGWIGQTIAGLASFAGVLLVWTGISLALRRWSAWRARQARSGAVEAAVNVSR